MELVRAIGGVQAQVLSAAELAVGVRVDGVTRSDVADELWERRRLVKTWAHRGTLHLLPADELPIWSAALRLDASWRTPEWRERYGLDPAQPEALLEATRDALDGACLTREELAGAVAERVGDWARERLLSGWGELLYPAASEGVLVFGPSRGRNVTFVRGDQWIGSWRDADPQQALDEVFRRFLRVYGPARPRDFARWLSVQPASAEAAAERLRDEVAEVRIGRRRALQLADEPDAAPAAGSVRLLPRYDAYVLGCHPRESVVPPAARDRLRDHPRGRFESASGHYVLLVDGLVAGIWEPRRQRGAIEVRVEPFVDLTRPQRAELESEAERIGAFLETGATLALGPLVA